MDAFKFPVSFSTDTREIVKLREGSDDYIKQIISICILTEPFTLPLTPDFGTADPSFSIHLFRLEVDYSSNQTA